MQPGNNLKLSPKEQTDNLVLENTWWYLGQCPSIFFLSFCSPGRAVADINPGTGLRPLCPHPGGLHCVQHTATMCYKLCVLLHPQYICSIFPQSIRQVCIPVWFIVWQTGGPHALICPRAPHHPHLQVPTSRACLAVKFSWGNPTFTPTPPPPIPTPPPAHLITSDFCRLSQLFASL